MLRLALVSVVFFAACSPSTPDAAGVDASSGTTGSGSGNGGSGKGGSGSGSGGGGIPATITISGQAIVQGQSSSSPQAGVAIAVYATGNDSTALATATTDSSGNYSLQLPTHGQPVDGYIKATMSGLVDTYVYPPAPMSADSSNATASMVSTDDYSGLVGIEGADSSNGMIILDVLDASLAPVSGAKVSSNPASGKSAYMNSSGQPFSSSSTYTDGLAFLFDVPTSGAVTVSASKSGMTFASHAVTARGGALTTTVVVAQ
jgi:hypothetical protein